MSVRIMRTSLRSERRSNRMVTGSVVLLGVISLLALIGPLLISHDYASTDFAARLVAPAATDGHWFGTDELGRDLLARTFLGIKVTLFVALIASFVSITIGVAYGAIAGFAGGRVDALMMRAVDALYALPFIFFVILLMVVFGRNFWLIFVAIGAINWLDMARIVRGQTINLKNREFVEAARLLGVSPARIVARHITPNLLGVVLVYVTLSIPQAILIESFLSFLGLGVQEPQTSLGALVSNGVTHMETAPWILLIPATTLRIDSFLFLTFLAMVFATWWTPRDAPDGIAGH